jgi:hypothetical protein
MRWRTCQPCRCRRHGNSASLFSMADFMHTPFRLRIMRGLQKTGRAAMLMAAAAYAIDGEIASKKYANEAEGKLLVLLDSDMWWLRANCNSKPGVVHEWSRDSGSRPLAEAVGVARLSPEMQKALAALPVEASPEEQLLVCPPPSSWWRWKLHRASMRRIHAHFQTTACVAIGGGARSYDWAVSRATLMFNDPLRRLYVRDRSSSERFGDDTYEIAQRWNLVWTVDGVPDFCHLQLVPFVDAIQRLHVPVATKLKSIPWRLTVCA